MKLKTFILNKYFFLQKLSEDITLIYLKFLFLDSLKIKNSLNYYISFFFKYYYYNLLFWIMLKLNITFCGNSIL